MQLSYLITGSVGAGGTNRAVDVRVVQLLLNGWLARANHLAVDGIVGPLTTAAIVQFQQAAQVPAADGRVDPAGPTMRALTDIALRGIATGFTTSNAFTAALAAEPESDPSITDLRAALSASLGAYRALGG